MPLVVKIPLLIVACMLAIMFFNSIYHYAGHVLYYLESSRSELAEEPQTTQQEQRTQQGDSSDSSSADAGDGEQQDASGEQVAGYYYFDRISEEDQAKYTAVYQALATRTPQDYPNHDQEDVKRIYQYVTADHPELFYVMGHSITWLEGDEAGKVEGDYCYTEAEQAQYEADLENAVAECEAGIPDGADDYQKALYVFDYLVDNVSYNYYARDNKDSLPFAQRGGNAVNCLLEHSCVCSGYSAAYQLIMNDLGIPCTTVTGNVVDRGSHAWNAVQLDGDWYYVDATWGEYNEALGGGEEESSFFPPHVSFYGYMCVTAEDLQSNRTTDDWQILPECAATQDNYYVRAGRMLDVTDEERIVAWCEQSREDGSNFLQFRCANREVYDQAKRFVEEDLVNVGGFSIRYSLDDDARTLVIAIE